MKSYLRSGLSIFIALSIFCGFLFSACEKKEPAQVEITLADNADVEFPGTGGTHTVDFTAGASWNITLSQQTKTDEWITVSPMSGGAGKQTLNITLQPNNSGIPRSGEIKITAGNTVKNIPVKRDEVSKAG